MELTDAIAAVWENYDDEQYRRDQSHWRGVGRWADDVAWKQIGQRSVLRVSQILQYIGHKERLFSNGLTLLEWGPGGGANLYAFRRIARTYFGVDISQKNLDECRRMISDEKFDNFRPILLSGQPSDIRSNVDEQVDVFLSTAVFQHFPNKQYGGRVLEAIRAVCTTNSVGFVQIRFDNGNKKYLGNVSIEDYKKKHLYATSYQLDEFWNFCYTSGFQPLYFQDINSDNNYATICLKAR